MGDTVEETPRSAEPGAVVELGSELATAIVELGPDGILVVDGAGRVRFANAQAEAILGYPRQIMARLRIEDLVPERLRDRHLAHRAAYAGAPRPRPMGVGLELYALRSDGTEVPVLISLSPANVGGRLVTIAVMREASEHRASEAAAREALLAADQERIATDLHNRIIELLFDAGMGIQSVIGMADGPVAERLRDAVKGLDAAIREIRNTVFGPIAPSAGPEPAPGVEGPPARNERRGI